MRELVFMRKVRSLRVTCTRGACWITWEGGPDVVLRAGETLEVRHVRRFCLEYLAGGEATLGGRDDFGPPRSRRAVQGIRESAAPPSVLPQAAAVSAPSIG
jgi:hypothetical protein